jgi:predicted RecA/RadA family phage recombinase
MKNFRQDGDILTVAAPYDCLSGDFIQVGALFGVCVNNALSGADVDILREGVFTGMPKATSSAWAVGDALYWDASGKSFTKVATGNLPVAVAVDAALIGDTTGNVSIESVPEASGLNAVGGVAAGYKIARGVHQQAAASDTVATGLTTVVACGANWRDTPTLKQMFLTTSIGDQAGAPVAGSILIKSFKPTAANDVTPIAASDFTDNLSSYWWAVGT